MRTPLSVVTILALSLAATTALAAGPKLAVDESVRAERQELASLRRELAAATLVKRLELTKEQKRVLQGVIADAKALKAKAANGKDADAMRGRREALLKKAIVEARASGKVSSETRVAMEDLRDDAREGMEGLKDERKAIMKKLKGVFTEDQLETLGDMRKEAQKHAQKHAGKKPSKAGRHGGMFLRLLMSEEFSSELAR